MMRKHYYHVNLNGGDFPGGSVVKSLPANAGDVGSILAHMPLSN